ncbi:GNAT family N-acetyltransferase [Brevibacillus ginsengisoli]|uniref:GNAT family N-acetyltransferase n=1 Tax=Brevibacillus ginsengisoli TaxID=363854 RepID=UPI003CF4FEE1
MHKKIYTETKRLVLRQVETEDVEAFHRYRSNPNIAKFQSWENYQYEQAAKFIEEQASNTPNVPGAWFQYAVALKEGQLLIGDCAVHTLQLDPRVVEIGFTLAPEYQGRGLATEAVIGLLDYLFEKLQKHKVIAHVNVANTSSIRLLERIGMRREAHFLENYFIKGQWVDEYLYAILEREWLSHGQSITGEHK